MSFAPQLLTVAGVMLLACVSPGPDLLAVTSHALSRRGSGLAAAAGIATSHLVWASLAVFGLGVAVSQFTWLYETIRFAGAAYVFLLGSRMLIGLRKSAVSDITSELRATNWPRAFQKGLLIGLTNPKGAAFFGSLFITVLPRCAPGWVQCSTLVIVLVVSSSWFCAAALLFSSGKFQRGYVRLRQPIDAVMGTLLVALSAKLAFD
jgi:threonine efflux protein